MWIYIYIYTHIHTYIHTYMCIYIYIYTDEVQICMHVCMYVCMYIYIYIYIYMSTLPWGMKPVIMLYQATRRRDEGCQMDLQQPVRRQVSPPRRSCRRSSRSRWTSARRWRRSKAWRRRRRASWAASPSRLWCPWPVPGRRTSGSSWGRYP